MVLDLHFKGWSEFQQIVENRKRVIQMKELENETIITQECAFHKEIKKTALYVKGHHMCSDKKENDNIGDIGQDLQENAMPLSKGPNLMSHTMEY